MRCGVRRRYAWPPDPRHCGKGIQALVNLDHRGAAGAEKNTGDGAGILIQVPDRFYREELGSKGVELPPAGEYATGIAFLPASRMAALDAMRAVERIIEEEGLQFIAWRDVATDNSSSVPSLAMPNLSSSSSFFLVLTPTATP